MTLASEDLRELKSLPGLGSQDLATRITVQKGNEALKWVTLQDFMSYASPFFIPAAGGGGPLPPPPGAPLSVTAPSVGTPRDAQWALQDANATGPRHAYANGKWNTTHLETPGIYPARPNDPYLRSLGFYYNNYGDLWIPFTWNNPGGSVVIADYDFLGAPNLMAWGDLISITVIDCANFNISTCGDINRNPNFTYTVVKFQITYCDMDKTRWDLMCKCTFELGPYNRVRNTPQEFGFGGGYLQDIYMGINIHHNYITGGGCNPAPGAHIEWLQSLLAVSGTGSYVYVEDNMIDFSKDGQANPAIREGWTGIISCGGDQKVKWNRNICKGMDIVQWLGLHPPGGLGTVVAYSDANVLAGCEILDNCFSYNPSFGPSYHHGTPNVLRPTQSGNRWFRDADSDTAGVPLVKADNVPLTIANFA